ncbi:MAG: hypothetical protein QXK74_07250 [Candidatus Nitrosocaldaceae archaeon]
MSSNSNNQTQTAVVVDPSTGYSRTLHLSQSDINAYQKAGYTVITQDKVYSNQVQLNPLQERVFTQAIQKPPEQRTQVEQSVVNYVESQLAKANMPYKTIYTQSDEKGTYVAKVESDAPIKTFSTSTTQLSPTPSPPPSGTVSSQYAPSSSSLVQSVGAIAQNAEEWKSAMQNTLQVTQASQYEMSKAQTLKSIEESSLPAQLKSQVYQDVLYDQHVRASQRLQDYYTTETQRAITEVAKSQHLTPAQKFDLIGYIAGSNTLDYTSQYERSQDISKALARINTLYRARYDYATQDMMPQMLKMEKVHGTPAPTATATTQKIDRVEEAKKLVDEFIQKNNLHLSEDDRKMLIITLANKGEINEQDLQQLAQTRLKEYGFLHGFGHAYISNIPFLNDFIYSFAPDESRRVRTYLELSRNADILTFKFDDEFSAGASTGKVYQISEMVIGGLGLAALAKQGVQVIRNPRLVADIFKRSTTSVEGLAGESTAVIKMRDRILPTTKEIVKGMIEIDPKASIQALRSKPQYQTVDVAHAKTPATPKIFVQKNDIEVIDVRTARAQEITKNIEKLKLQRVEDRTAKSLADFYAMEAFAEGKSIIEKRGLPIPTPTSTSTSTSISPRPAPKLEHGYIAPEEYHKTPAKSINEIIHKKDVDLAEPISANKIPKGVIPEEELPRPTSDYNPPAKRITSKEIDEGITPYEELGRREQAMYSERFDTPPTSKTGLKYEQVHGKAEDFDVLKRFDTDYNTALLTRRKSRVVGEGFAYEFIRYPEHSEPAIIHQFKDKPNIEWKEDEKIYVIDITDNLEKIIPKETNEQITRTRTTDITLTKDIDLNNIRGDITNLIKERDLSVLDVFGIKGIHLSQRDTQRDTHDSSDSSTSTLIDITTSIVEDTTTRTARLQDYMQREVDDQVIKHARILKTKNVLDSLFPKTTSTKKLNELYSKQVKYTFEDVFNDL